MGPLAGVRVVELGGIGPGPFASMLLADMGAEVLRLERRASAERAIKGFEPRHRLLNRGRPSITLDLKAPGAIEATRKLIAKADAVIEGFRPGVVERLGLGPDAALGLNPRPLFLAQKGREFAPAHYTRVEAEIVARALHERVMTLSSFAAKLGK